MGLETTVRVLLMNDTPTRTEDSRLNYIASKTTETMMKHRTLDQTSVVKIKAHLTFSGTHRFHPSIWLLLYLHATSRLHKQERGVERPLLGAVRAWLQNS